MIDTSRDSPAYSPPCFAASLKQGLEIRSSQRCKNRTDRRGTVKSGAYTAREDARLRASRRSSEGADDSLTLVLTSLRRRLRRVRKTALRVASVPAPHAVDRFRHTGASLPVPKVPADALHRRVKVTAWIAGDGSVYYVAPGTEDDADGPRDLPEDAFALQVRARGSPFDRWLVYVTGIRNRRRRCSGRSRCSRSWTAGRASATCASGTRRAASTCTSPARCRKT